MGSRLSLDTVRARVRRLQLVVGLGFGSAVLGAILVSPVTSRLDQPTGSLLLSLLGYAALTRLWVWLVLPVLSYGFARILPLDPMGTAVGAGLTGELFWLMLDLVSGGLEGMLANWPLLVVNAFTLALGIFLTRFAVRRGRLGAERAQQRASTVAAQQKEQYAEFAREAERLAALHEAREARASGSGGDASTPAEQSSDVRR